MQRLGSIVMLVAMAALLAAFVVVGCGCAARGDPGATAATGGQLEAHSEDLATMARELEPQVRPEGRPLLAAIRATAASAVAHSRELLAQFSATVAGMSKTIGDQRETIVRQQVKGEWYESLYVGPALRRAAARAWRWMVGAFVAWCVLRGLAMVAPWPLAGTILRWLASAMLAIATAGVSAIVHGIVAVTTWWTRPAVQP